MLNETRRYFLAVTISIFAVLSVESSVCAQTKSQNDAELMSAYNAAIYDASVYKFSNLRPLKRLEFDSQTHTARVVTLTSFGYTPGVTKPLAVDVWVRRCLRSKPLARVSRETSRLD